MFVKFISYKKATKMDKIKIWPWHPRLRQSSNWGRFRFRNKNFKRRLSSPHTLFSLISIRYHPKMQQNSLLHCDLVFQDKSLTFSCLKKKKWFQSNFLQMSQKHSQLMSDFFFRQQKILLKTIIVRLNPGHYAAKLYLYLPTHYNIFDFQAWFAFFPW